MYEILWTRTLLDAQGLHVPKTKVYQDNRSTILHQKTEKYQVAKEQDIWM